MKWHQIRDKYPNCWVLVEALSVISKNHKRLIEEMSVWLDSTETKDAWNAYKEHHLANPECELYLFHASHDSVEVLEQSFNGIRGNLCK